MNRIITYSLSRKLGNQSKPLVTVAAVDDKTISFKQESLVKTSEFKCEIGKPFEETTADGRKVKFLLNKISILEYQHYLKYPLCLVLNVSCYPTILQVKSLMTATKPSTLKHEMKGTEGGKDSVCVREFLEGTMKCVCTVDDIVTTRIYTRQK